MVSVDGSANVAFVRCRFLNNSATSGSVMDITNSPSLIYMVDTVFENNHAFAGGGGVVSFKHSQILMVCAIERTIKGRFCVTSEISFLFVFYFH